MNRQLAPFMPCASGGRARRFGLVWSACGLLGGLMALAGCGARERDSGGLIVRQVVTGSNEATTGPAGPAPAGDVAAGAAPAGVLLGSTLVSDTPRALYRRAYERSRRRADGSSSRERLAALDDSIRDATFDFSLTP